MIQIFLTILTLTIQAQAYDCSNLKPFVPFETQNVQINVERIYTVIEKGQPVEKTEQICKTQTPFEVGVLDIRSREEEWYYCHSSPEFICETTFQNKPALLIVRPAAVIRSFKEPPASARDTHAHVFLLPQDDRQRYFDTFVRSLSFDLKKQPLILDASSGDRGPDSEQGIYFVRMNFN